MWRSEELDAGFPPTQRGETLRPPEGLSTVAVKAALNCGSLFSDVGEQDRLVAARVSFPLPAEHNSGLSTDVHYLSVARHRVFQFNAIFFYGVPSPELLIGKKM